jgi:hypothetical protein
MERKWKAHKNGNIAEIIEEGSHGKNAVVISEGELIKKLQRGISKK